MSGALPLDRLAELERAANQGLLPEEELPRLIRAIASYYGIPAGRVCSPSKERRLVWLRALVVYLARRYARASYPKIGAAIGRDHARAWHLYRQYKEELEKNETLRAHTLEVIEALKLEKK
jgi:chromosomal replication initiation ATPase DnaA